MQLVTSAAYKHEAALSNRQRHIYYMAKVYAQVLL